MHFLITAGGTREYIDPVRFISNASSGKMGYALVCAAIKAGHKVTLITTSTAQKPPKGTKVVNVETAGQMLKAVKNNFSKCDSLIMTAAVSDYTPVKKSGTKIKKSDKPMTIKLKPTTDILKWAGKHKKKDQVVVGFALESKAVRTSAENKMKTKNLDMIIANSPAAIGAEKASVEIKRLNEKWLKIPLATKAAIAKKIITLTEMLLTDTYSKSKTIS